VKRSVVFNESLSERELIKIIENIVVSHYLGNYKEAFEDFLIHCVESKKENAVRDVLYEWICY